MKNTTFKKIYIADSKTKDGVNIKKSLASFNVLNKKTKGRVVTFSSENKIYSLMEDGDKVVVSSVPEKISIKTRTYKL